MLKIGEVTKSYAGRGRDSWLKADLIAEAKRISVSIKSNWNKEQIGNAIRERQKAERSEPKESKGGEEKEGSRPKKIVIQKERPRGFTDGNVQFFEEEVRKIGFNFKKMQKWKTYTVYYAKHFGPLKFREESKIRITSSEVWELLLCNGFKRANVYDRDNYAATEELLRSFLRLFSLEFELVDWSQTLSKEAPDLPTREIQEFPCLYTSRELRTFTQKYPPYPGIQQFGDGSVQHLNNLLGVVTDLQRPKPWKDNSTQGLNSDFAGIGEIPRNIPREKMLWIRMLLNRGVVNVGCYYTHRLLSVDDVNKSLEEKKTAVVPHVSGQGTYTWMLVTVPPRTYVNGATRDGGDVYLEQIHYDSFFKICGQRGHQPEFVKLFGLLSAAKVTGNPEEFKVWPLSDSNKELLFSAAQNGADIKELGLRDNYRKVRSERIGEYTRALSETPLARDTAWVIEGFLAKHA
jgi:hypothetical protein